MRCVTLASEADRAGRRVTAGALWQPQSLWESYYQHVMGAASEEGHLSAFWRHYHGEPAEMQVEGPELLRWSTECDRVMRRLPFTPLGDFLRDLGRMCNHAHRVGAALRVIAD